MDEARRRGKAALTMKHSTAIVFALALMVPLEALPGGALTLARTDHWLVIRGP